ncbi:MAG: alpha/beta hydrolase, partial [Rhodospirillales bacterium]|nr:alpha/beta hydrolase [Rhodospirillales bacterium]
APDFTEALIWAQASPEQRATLERDGVFFIHNPYEPDNPEPITRRLIEDGRRHLLLGGPIALDCPVRLIHGQRDADVPWQTSLRLAECLRSEDIAVTLVKKAGHRLSEPEDMALMERVLDALLERLASGTSG